MKELRQKAFKVEALFAAVHSSYWMAMCSMTGFMAVYLAFYGFSDTLVGVTASLVSLISIVVQLAVSSFSDANPRVPLKKIITLMYLVMLVLVAVLALLPLPMVLMLLVYSLGGGLGNSLPGLFNAQLMRYVNAGMPLNLGWPRGVSSIVYAVTAFFIGLLLENYSASILMPICLVLLVLAIVFNLFLPKAERDEDQGPIADLAQPQAKTSLLQLLGHSRVLQVFLVMVVLMSAGQMNTMLFLPRVISALGGNKADLGMAMLIQAGVEMPAMFLTPWLLRRFRARAILGVSLLGYYAKYLLLYLASSMAAVYVGMFVSMLCFGLYGITSVYFVNDIVRDNEKVRAQSLVMAAGALSVVLGNVLAGMIVDHYGIAALNLICMLLEAAAALMMLLCGYLQAREEKAPRLEKLA